jgi:hypothetical protein
MVMTMERVETTYEDFWEGCEADIPTPFNNRATQTVYIHVYVLAVMHPKLSAFYHEHRVLDVGHMCWSGYRSTLKEGGGYVGHC